MGKIVHVNGTRCSSCQPNSFCDGVKETACSVGNALQAEKCENGTITLCQNGMKIETTKDQSQFLDQKCSVCTGNMICDGVKELSCADANAVECSGGIVKKCKPHFEKLSNAVFCSACERESSICGKFPTCERNQYRKFFECFTCVDGMFCNGSEIFYNCREANALNAGNCNGENITRCKDRTHYFD